MQSLIVLILHTKVPIVYMHGLVSDANASDITRFLGWVQEETGAYTHSCEVGDGHDSTLFMTVEEQVNELYRCIKDDKNFDNGFIGIGHSQGGYLLRQLAQEFNHKDIKMLRLVTMNAPLGGFYCGRISNCHDVDLPDWLMDLAPLIYTDFIQELVGPTNYWRDPYEVKRYLKVARSLPMIDNLRDYQDYRKQNYMKLDLHVAFASPNDETMRPWSSGWFGSWADDDEKMTDFKDRDVFLKDTFGLKTMFEQGRFIPIQTEYGHVGILTDEAYVRLVIVPYLNMEAEG